MKDRLRSLYLHIKKIGAIQTLGYLLQRLFLKKGGIIKIKIKGLKNPVRLRNKFFDTNIFYQVFISGEVDFEISGIPCVIIDCGANIGLSTLFFKKKYPFCKIFSIEPELSNFKMLQLNTMGYDGIIEINSAIWATSGIVNIIDNGEGHAAFQTTGNLVDQNMIAQIPSIRIEDIIQVNSISQVDLLKIDIEGSEYEIFSNNVDSWIKKIHVLAIEIHEKLRPGVTQTIDKALKKDFARKQYGEYTVYTAKYQVRQ